MAIEVERINRDFEGEFTFRGRNYSVPFTLPGDRVQFHLKRVGRKLLFETRHIEKSEHPPENLRLTDPICIHYGECGGCRGQHFEYEEQLRLKMEPVRNEMQQLFGIEPERIEAPALSGYRNRMDFVVNGAVLGFRAPGNFTKFIDIEMCPVQRERSNRYLSAVRGVLHSHPGIGFDRNEGTGILKYVTIRSGNRGGVVILVTDMENRTKDASLYEPFLSELLRALQGEEEISVMECETERNSELSAPPGGSILTGTGEFTELLGGIEFRVPYDSFFQPNPSGFDRLLDRASEFLEQTPGSKCMLDLYSGSGTLSRIFNRRLGGRFHSIIGFDFIASSIAVANANQESGVERFQFFERDLNRGTGEPEQIASADLVLCDPPRAGLSPTLRRELLEHATAPWMLYISCNPSSHIRDLKELQARYRPVRSVLVDCFPHTPHLEQATLLVQDGENKA